MQVVYDGASFCAALPMAVPEPSAELDTVLAGWDIRTVGEFLRLPVEGLVERLGAEALQLRRRASGRARRVLRLVRPAERFVEAFDFDYAIETTEPLLFLLRRFADALSVSLRALHRAAAARRTTCGRFRFPRRRRMRRPGFGFWPRISKCSRCRSSRWACG